MVLPFPKIESIEQVIGELQGWCEKYLPNNAEEGKIELAEVINAELLRKVVKTLQWHHKDQETHEVKEECTKILRWTSTTDGVLSQNLDENPFVANQKEFSLKLIDTLQDIAQNAREELAAKKPQKPTGDSVGQLIKYIDTVLDDIQQLKACRSRNPYVNKYIRIELAVAYNETKKCVEKILTGRPEIKDAPAESDDPEKYLRSAHTWCVGQLFWENGERIGAEKTADKSAEKPAETGQKEIVEVKPGAFGITVNIKEISRRIWKCVCSRSKD